MTTVELKGATGYGFGSNSYTTGIAATASGKTLVIVEADSGQLFTVAANGMTHDVSLALGVTVPGASGILLDGRTLYVAESDRDTVAKFSLAANLRRGHLLRRISSPQFDAPTGLADLRHRLYVVNARYVWDPQQTASYWISRVKK